MTSPGVDGGIARLAYITGPLLNERLGIEVNFAIPYTHGTIGDHLTELQVGFWRERGPGETKLHPVLVWDIRANSLDIRVDFTHVATLRTSLSDYFFTSESWLTWQNIKLICDLPNAKFIKAYFNEMEFDISGYDIPGIAPVHIYPWLNSFVVLRDLDVVNGARGTVYLGNIILTMEE